MKKQGFPAVVDENTKILIFGSLPGDVSIRKHQYYGHPGNDFWRLLGNIIGEDLQNMSYQNRLETLKRNKIGLWDVFKAGKRKGSEDTKIKDEEINQFSVLKDMAPNLKLVLFNGKKSGEYEPIIKAMGYETKVLPSSSGANRRSSNSRKLEWEAAFKRY
ncbi:G:T/U mismatch-specific uracil/thymine DNA-glycosylase [Methanosarcina barkeri 3]|uniref:G:T/U mismatch-specific uracil/thymine DNA-glycosylase n=1 Tax=Methanosarcina barkeri 3 TaxID=1434107 RepID=A0A0E3SNE6_METBA|nr:DNA-deoxyinosine glycosylase [Methanosarcina barkeri]AKB82678.1 G:T/U mismatch-specific uracil/thymine DNA-glycosylase [Methanosarcina barkeri 3]